MANTSAFANWVTMDALRILQNKLKVASEFNTNYNKELQREFPVGETFQVKLPQRWITRKGTLSYSAGPINRKTVPVICNRIVGVDFDWDSIEAALKMERGQEQIRAQYIEPAIVQIANEVDSDAALFAYQNTNNIVGQLAVTPTTHQTYLDAKTRLTENAAGDGPRTMIVSPQMQNTIAANNLVLFTTNANDRILKTGDLGNADGFTWNEENNLWAHTAGTWAGAVTVTSAPVNGATSLTITATAGDTFKTGDVISVDLVYNVNPVNRRSTGRLKQFVVTQDLTAAGGGADVLNVSPAILGPGDQYQNVSALPAANAALTLFPGTTSPNGKVAVNGLAFARDAFAMVNVKLEMPKMVEIASQTRDPETGITIRFVRAWDQQQSKMTNRFDVCYGFGSLYADNCSVRVLSAQ